jgi:F0F1-type ATP synthase membrane subunit a
MENHYTYLHSLGLVEANHQKMVTAVMVGLALVFIGSGCAKILTRKRNRLGIQSGVVPDEKISSAGILDFFVESFASFQDSILGKENRKYLPLTATVFLYVFFLNIISLIPGIPSATTTVWVQLLRN